MKKRIFKWILAFSDIQCITMPINSKILSVQKQNDDICMWALVDKDEFAMENRMFSVYCTGNVFDHNESDIYIGTVQYGPYVYHVFELINNK